MCVCVADCDVLCVVHLRWYRAGPLPARISTRISQQHLKRLIACLPAWPAPPPCAPPPALFLSLNYISHTHRHAHSYINLCIISVLLAHLVVVFVVVVVFSVFFFFFLCVCSGRIQTTPQPENPTYTHAHTDLQRCLAAAPVVCEGSIVGAGPL